MKSAIQAKEFRARVLVKPQFLQLSDAQGNIAMDYVGRYETLQNSVDEICLSLKVESSQLQKRNTSEHQQYREYYDEELKSAVEIVYAEDLRRFNYSY